MAEDVAGLPASCIPSTRLRIREVRMALIEIATTCSVHEITLRKCDSSRCFGPLGLPTALTEAGIFAWTRFPKVMAWDVQNHPGPPYSQ